MALSALTPRHGQDEACEALPKNSHLTLMMPRLGRHTWVPQRPWIIMAASTSLKTPASISLTLPAPPSSAGVPITCTRPAKGSLPRAAAMAAPGPGPGPSMVARKAVGRPPTPRSIRAPCFSRKPVSHAEAFSSLKHSSGLAWIWCESFSRSSARRSTASATLVLAWSSGSAVMRELLPGRLHASGVGQQVIGRHGHGLGGRYHSLTRHRLDGGLGKVARVDGHALGSDPDHGLDGGYDLTDVAHVRGALTVGDGGAFRETDGCHVGREELEEDAARLHRLVDAVVLGHREPAAGGLGRAFRAGDHAPIELPHGVDAGGPDIEDRRSGFGDDIGRHAAARDDAVNAAVGTYLLAQHGHGVVSLDAGVQL